MKFVYNSIAITTATPSFSSSPLLSFDHSKSERFAKWLADQQSSGGEFTEEQMEWLVAIKDHIASSLMIEQDDFEYAPFNQFGGIGRAYELFGDRLDSMYHLTA